MSVICREIIKAMEEYAPPGLAEGWDNVGLMTGESEGEVNKILVALDVNNDVIDEAIALGAQLIITHHPLIFKPVKNINDTTPLGRRLLRLIKNNISVYSAHTNLDFAKEGTNAVLAGLLGLKNTEGLAEINPDFAGAAMGRIGDLEREMPFGALVERVKAALGADRLTICGSLNRPVKRAALCTGKGAEFMGEAAAKGAEVYITGDLGYHDGQMAQDLGLCVIDGTHYLTEVIAVPVICKYLRNKFPDLEIAESKVNGQTLTII